MKGVSAVAGVLLLTPSFALAELDNSFPALVISVDSKAQTIRVNQPDAATPPKWTAVEAHWDGATIWKNCPKKYNECETVNADLAAMLKKDAKVYVEFNDQDSGGKTWHIEELRTMPSDIPVP